MASWEEISLTTIFPEEMADLLATAKSTVEALSEIVSLLASFVETAASVIIDFIDPVRKITQEIIDAINEFIKLFITSQLSILYIPVGPRSRGFTQSTDQFIRVFENSLYDTSDPNRPKFAGTTSSLVIMLLVGAPGFGDIVDNSNKLSKLFKADILKIREPFPLEVKSTLSEPLIPSILPQRVFVSGTTEDFPDSGIIKIGDETTTYSGKTSSSLLGALIRTTHIPGEAVTIVRIDGLPIGTTTRLSASIDVAGIETEFFVETTDGFPDTGSFEIGGDILTYSSKTSVSFIGVLPKKSYAEGLSCTLKSGRSFHGGPPDWESISLHKTFDEFDYLIRGLDTLASAFLAANRFSEEVADFARQLVIKVDEIRKDIDSFLESIVRFAELLSISGVHILAVEGSGTKEDLVFTIKESEGKPDFDESSFTAGVVLMASASGAEALGKLFGV